MSHTPGPWTVEAWPADCGAFAGRPWVKGGNQMVVAHVEEWGADGNAESQSNARLIASAPDLLAALDALAGRVQGMADHALGLNPAHRHDLRGIVASALEVIDRATGQDK